MRLLLLAGSDEARHIASALRRESRVSVTVALARPGRRPQAFGWPLRIGGWGGDAAFSEWVNFEGFDAIIDATDPFASQMAHRTARTAADLGIDYIRFLRPAWVPDPRDTWTFLNAECDAAHHIPEKSTVFVASGRHDQEKIRALKGRRVFWRVDQWPVGSFPFDGGHFVFDAGPYTVNEEQKLFERLGVEWLIARNTGSAWNWPKLEAARELGIKVAMVRRPRQPEGPKIASVAETLAWVRRRL